MELSEIVAKYGTPNPALVAQRDNGKGALLSYVGHADVTKMLIEIDPMWTWEPAGWIEGRPAIHRHHAKMVFRNGDVKETEIATMWGYMTVLGKTIPCVGSAPADKEDVEKELIGDLIRNGALRFGVCVNLWSKSDDAAPVQQTSAPRQYETRASDRQETRSAEPTALTGSIRVKGDQHGELPQWLIDQATKKGVVEVYDNRKTATLENRRPWFKCTSNDRLAFWPPDNVKLEMLDTPPPVQYVDDEEPF